MVRTAKQTNRVAKSAKATSTTRGAQPQKKVPAAVKKPTALTGRIAAAGVRLGMTPAEVRNEAGHPECILFGSDDHVEWQFGAKGVDPVGAPTLYVTTLTFAAGRVVRITERMADAT